MPYGRAGVSAKSIRLGAAPAGNIACMGHEEMPAIPAELQVFMRDVEQVLMPVLMIAMYLTPILYPISRVPENVRPWAELNPFGYVVTRMRDFLIDGSLGYRLQDLHLLVGAVLAYAGGRWVFLRLSPNFEEFI